MPKNKTKISAISTPAIFFQRYNRLKIIPAPIMTGQIYQMKCRDDILSHLKITSSNNITAVPANNARNL